MGTSDSDKFTEEPQYPEWATPKDIRDFKTILEEDQPLMFDGVPISDDDKEKIKRVMEAMFRNAKKKNKEAYGRKRQRTDVWTKPYRDLFDATKLTALLR